MALPIYYRQRGEGKPLIFIHGFPMSQEIWNDFVPRFTDSHNVITLDLPGFGKSPGLQSPFTVDQVGEQLLHFLTEKNFLNGIVIGHSLGGYVTLAMVAKAPQLFSAVGLFHSTAYADSAEKKESRTKAIDFVERNGAEAFTTNFILPLFADPRHSGVERVKKIAAQSSAETVIGYTRAMRDRNDQIKTLKNFKKPTLFLAGEKDPGIPVDTILEQAKSCQQAEIHILRDVAHMGMLEKPEETAVKIKSFLHKT